MKVTVSFTLDDKVDADIVSTLDRITRRKRSEFIREALHAHINGRAGVTLTDVYQAINELKRDLGRVQISQASQVAAWDDEPAIAAAALDALAKL